MPTKKIINNKFTVLRNWLFPGLIWDQAPPDRVGEELVPVIDIEHWVEVPRFTCHVTSPAAGAGRAAQVLFENFMRNPDGRAIPLVTPGGIDTARASRFNVTDIWARLAFLGTAACGVETRRQFPGITVYSEPANLDWFNTGYMIPSGDEPFVGIFSGDGAFPTSGDMSLNQAGDAYTWVPLPDLTPGNGYKFTSQTANAVMHLDFMWTERRPPGQPNVGS